MGRRRIAAAAVALAGALIAAACGARADDPVMVGSPVGSTTALTAVPTTTTAPPTTTTLPPPTTVPAPPPRLVTEQAWVPFAAAGEVLLTNPSRLVERVGFHQAAHDGAQQLDLLEGAVAPVTLEDRERNTGDRTAADVVVEPATEVRAPVTGTVLRASTYVLYCAHEDSYVVIEPDAHPGWEVKVLHITGLLVAEGARVIAGMTPIAAHPTQLPFASQVDDHRTVEPAWPHVHIEVVDPSIPNLPSAGEGC